MGVPMATNIAGAGFRLTLWNRSVGKAASLARELDGAVAETPRQLAEACDVVITMLSDDRASEQVHSGVDGLLAADAGADYFVEMGTHSPQHVEQMAAEAAGRVLIDAPVSGSIDAAREAQLLILVGADEQTVNPIRPVLDAMSREVICFGRVGAGATIKLAINLLIHGLNQTLAEALTLAEAAGIELGDAYRAMEQSAAAAPMLAYRKPQYLAEASSPVSFALSLARKDVALAMQIAEDLHVAMPQARVNLDQLRAADDAGFGDRDMAAMLNYLRGAE